MIPTRIECGCARTQCGGGVVGREGCEWCGGEGYRLVQCVECADSGRLFGSDARCDCEHGAVEEGPPSAEAERLALQFKIAVAFA